MNKENDNTSKPTQPRQSTLARSLGYMALGLGATQLFACRRTARLLGLRPTPSTLWLLRALGARELLTGFGLLGRRPGPWLTTRLVGDALDLGLLFKGLAAKRRTSLLGRMMGNSGKARMRTALAGVAGISALDMVALARCVLGSGKASLEEHPTVRASITVDKTPSDVYAFWRNVENFPHFVSRLESVTSPDRIRSRWRLRLANKSTLDWESTIVEDTPDQRIVWKLQSATTKLFVDTVEVLFELAPGGRATEVHVTLHATQAARPAVASRWLRKLPQSLLFNQLHRFKQLIELGEITQSDSSIHMEPYPARPTPQAETSNGETPFERANTKPHLAYGAPS